MTYFVMEDLEEKSSVVGELQEKKSYLKKFLVYTALVLGIPGLPVIGWHANPIWYGYQDSQNLNRELRKKVSDKGARSISTRDEGWRAIIYSSNDHRFNKRNPLELRIIRYSPDKTGLGVHAQAESVDDNNLTYSINVFKIERKETLSNAQISRANK